MGTAILIDREATKRGGPTSGSEWASGPTTMTAFIFGVCRYSVPVAYTEGYGFRATCTAESVHSGDALTHICIGVLSVSRIA